MLSSQPFSQPGEGSPWAGQVWWQRVSAGGIPLCSPLPAQSCPGAAFQPKAKFASAMEILILLGTGEAEAAGTVQPSDPRGSNPCRIFPLPQHSPGLLMG